LILPRHRLIVAGTFRIAGFVIGAPSLLATLGLAGGAFIFGNGPPPDNSPYLSLKTYGPAGALQNGAQAVGNVFSFMDMLATHILAVLAIVALAVTLFAVLLYLTGRGLKASAAWARIVAGLLIAVALANCAIGLSALNRGGEIADGFVMAALVYGLWVLIWKFDGRAAPFGSPGAHAAPKRQNLNLDPPQS
jgi:hypothetical protein